MRTWGSTGDNDHLASVSQIEDFVDNMACSSVLCIYFRLRTSLLLPTNTSYSCVTNISIISFACGLRPEAATPDFQPARMRAEAKQSTRKAW